MTEKRQLSKEILRLVSGAGREPKRISTSNSPGSPPETPFTQDPDSSTGIEIDSSSLTDLLVTAGTGLNAGYRSGKVQFGTTVFSIAEETIALQASATNYLQVRASDGVVIKDITGYLTGNKPLARVVTDAAGITGITDDRAAFDLTGGSDFAPKDAKYVLTESHSQLPNAELHPKDASSNVRHLPEDLDNLRVTQIQGLTLYYSDGRVNFSNSKLLTVSTGSLSIPNQLSSTVFLNYNGTFTVLNGDTILSGGTYSSDEGTVPLWVVYVTGGAISSVIDIRQTWNAIGKTSVGTEILKNSSVTPAKLSFRHSFLSNLDPLLASLSIPLLDLRMHGHRMQAHGNSTFSRINLYARNQDAVNARNIYFGIYDITDPGNITRVYSSGAVPIPPLSTLISHSITPALSLPAGTYLPVIQGNSPPSGQITVVGAPAPGTALTARYIGYADLASYGIPSTFPSGWTDTLSGDQPYLEFQV